MNRTLEATGLITQLLGWLDKDEQTEVVRSLANGYGIHAHSCLPAIYTDQQVAERYNLSVYTVREWLKSGKLKGYKESRQWYVREPDLETFERRGEAGC
ncbi:helix-turn-helix domain-containing protein [Cohnella cholangitidis]|uniref:Helix-turn-helix domain-containing protein n=1 Tax=Cohnella cholangitidis TaxID=2598458 RepID=A0A7G5C5F5_9BACL|nr:helix-turn-helix domain-containing protein [Cohnella cholangitidis]QMV44439.1 helix-turn-helix domain-containing protein [Cohnella cholangitidis]